MYHIRFDKAIAKDVADMPRPARQRIYKSIETKLSPRPVAFGKPLRNSLQGYRSLRIGDYRVIYRIAAQDIHIVLIGH